jgi:hypothetical protein
VNPAERLGAGDAVGTIIASPNPVGTGSATSPELPRMALNEAARPDFRGGSGSALLAGAGGTTPGVVLATSEAQNDGSNSYPNRVRRDETRQTKSHF